jgi:26S proteasome regulatory subunit N3
MKRAYASCLAPPHPSPFERNPVLAALNMAEDRSEETKKDVDDKKTDKKDGEAVKPKPPPTPAAEIRANLALIHRGVTSLEPRFTNRVLRSLTSLRKKITPAILRGIVGEIYEKGE